MSESWEWREGRLLAYELILKFLITNHIHYVFPTYVLPASKGSATSSSVDETLISRYDRHCFKVGLFFLSKTTTSFNIENTCAHTHPLLSLHLHLHVHVNVHKISLPMFSHAKCQLHVFAWSIDWFITGQSGSTVVV